ncbi:hypothetical protein D3C81_1820020 [compost metagenome]
MQQDNITIVTLFYNFIINFIRRTTGKPVIGINILTDVNVVFLSALGDRKNFSDSLRFGISIKRRTK